MPIYTIDQTQSFLDVLASTLLDRHSGGSMGLSDVTVLMPHRRAVRSLADAFLRATDGDAIIMPNIKSLGDVDEDEINFVGAGLLPEDLLDFKTAINEKQRQVLLMVQVRRWIEKSGMNKVSPAQSWRLAGELASLMDQVETNRLDFDNLQDLVEKEFSHHWQITLDFLQLIVEQWPLILQEFSMENPAQRRDKLLLALAGMWEAEPPVKPVYVAGVTGNVKGAADVIKALSRSKNGHVVFPGVDLELSDDIWEVLDEAHPQYQLKKILDYIDVSRDAVVDLTEGVSLKQSEIDRQDLFKYALLPSESTVLWSTPEVQRFKHDDRESALSGLSLVTADSLREEGQAIALMMREQLNEDGKTAALVTTDRKLATYVRASLRRWGVEVDDSAGSKVSNTTIGSLMTLIAKAVAADFAPVPLLSLLQHPMVSGSKVRADFRQFTRRLDKFVLRGPRPVAGREGVLLRSYECAMDESNGFTSDDYDYLVDFLNCFTPLIAVIQSGANVADIISAHIEVAECVATSETVEGEDVLWSGEAGNVLADALFNLMDYATFIEQVSVEEYAPLYEEMVSDVVVRNSWSTHPRLFIWGAMESRLQHVDLMIIGSCNEGMWPLDIDPDPWMSRPMRKDFGLPSLEMSTGQAAHDFVQAASSDTVVFTRSRKVDGAPTVPSRWLMRIQALVGEFPKNTLPYLQWVEELDKPDVYIKLQAPAPCPPVEDRPDRLSVSDIQTWKKDPYALFAKKMLKVRPLDEIDEKPNAAQKGTLIHEILEKFLKDKDAPMLGQAGYDRLVSIGKEVFEGVMTLPTVYAFWWPRFLHVAEWFIDNYAQRRHQYDIAAVEVWGERKIPGLGFTVFAKADRIDINRETGMADIIDYKTGSVPTLKEIFAGYAPQMPLEAWILQGDDGFEGIANVQTANVEFWKTQGGTDPVQIKNPLKTRGNTQTMDDLLKITEEGLIDLVTAFQDPSVAYVSKPRPSKVTYDDYEHLSRSKEWMKNMEV